MRVPMMKARGMAQAVRHAESFLGWCPLALVERDDGDYDLRVQHDKAVAMPNGIGKGLGQPIEVAWFLTHVCSKYRADVYVTLAGVQMHCKYTPEEEGNELALVGGGGHAEDALAVACAWYQEQLDLQDLEDLEDEDD